MANINSDFINFTAQKKKKIFFTEFIKNMFFLGFFTKNVSQICDIIKISL